MAHVTRLALSAAVLSTALGCNTSKPSPTGPTPPVPAAASQSRIVSLTAVTPTGPVNLASGRDPVTLTFAIECYPPAAGSKCIVGFDFLEEDGSRIQRGAVGSGQFVEAGLRTVQAAGAPPAGYGGTTVGIRAAIYRDTTDQELAAAEFRQPALRFNWLK